MRLCTIASGSSGNCLLLSKGNTHILIDAGISARRITQALGQLDLSPAQLCAIVVTHEHSDHVAGVEVLEKRFPIPIWASAGTARQLCYRTAFLEERLQTFTAGDSFCIGDLSLHSFPTPHDAAESVGYVVSDGRRRVGIATDLGHVTHAVRAAVCGCDALVLESNHDRELLRAGRYPFSLKKRILSERGHLSNEEAAALAHEAALAGTRYITLAHLSQENNTPELARRASEGILSALGAQVSLQVAPRAALGAPCLL